MKNKPVIVVPIATSAGTLADLRKAGYVPVLCDFPEKVRLVTVGSLIDGNDVLMSAMHALTEANSTSSGESVRSDMVLELSRRMKENETKR